MVKRGGELDRVEILALDVLNDGELKGLLIVGSPDDDRDLAKPRRLRGPPAPFAGDDLVFFRRGLPYDNRLDDALALDRLRQFQQRASIEIAARLVWIR